MEKELIINSFKNEVDIALLEDKFLVELHKEKLDNNYAVGDVYLGRVSKIMPGLNAAFIDVGYEKDGFPPLSGSGSPGRSSDINLSVALSPKGPQPDITNFKLEGGHRKDREDLTCAENKSAYCCSDRKRTYLNQRSEDLIRDIICRKISGTGTIFKPYLRFSEDQKFDERNRLKRLSRVSSQTIWV